MQLARAWAWRNVLRAAYPAKRIAFLPLGGRLPGRAPGSTRSIPAHAGDVTKVFLVKRQIPDSSYPAVTSSFLVQTVFDTASASSSCSTRSARGCCRRCRGFPTCRPSRSPSGPTTRRRWRSRPASLLLAIAVGDLSTSPTACAASGPGSNRAWSILTEPRRYLREVAAWQGLGWLFRFAAFWFFLEAFGIGGSVGNVMLVMSVQAIANIVPFTPGGAGAQQALLVATLSGPSRTAVLSFSVGTQIAMAAWSVVLGFAAILLVFRTTDWRGLIRQAQEEKADEEAGGAGAGSKASAAGTS